MGNQPQVIDTSAVNTGGEDAEDFDSLTFTALDKVYPDFEQVIEQFTAQYRAMSEAGKLKLSTNTIVEDVIYQQSKDLAAIIQPHFWILDPDDPDVQSWFTTEEWDELKSKRLPLRRPDTNMVSQMAKFAGAKTLADYRAIAETPPPRPDGVYNFERDFDACWVNEVILKMVTLLERHDLLSSPDLQEGVFDSVIWSPLLDQCLLSLKGLLLQRKEITCRSLDSTLSTDPEFKFDGLVVSLTPRSNRRDRLEFAALEVSKASIAVESNKWVHDSMKVVVGLRAILSRLKRLAKGKDVRRLRVPGSVHAGLNARFAQMACVNENVYWLEWGQVRSVPTSVPMLKKVFELMISIWHFKTMIRDCFDAVQEHLNPEEQTQDELFEHLMARESGL